jgi:Fe-S cluster assembly iron-binding protein IscA
MQEDDSENTNKGDPLMLTVTPKASQKISEFLKERQTDAAIRLFLAEGG